MSRHQFVSKLGSSLTVIKAAACQVGRGRPNLFRWVFILIFTLGLSSSGPGENSLWGAELIFLLQQQQQQQHQGTVLDFQLRLSVEYGEV